jgi:hypothetical protein
MMKKKTAEVKEETKEDVKNLLLHLESEYRKANISEKQYKELKEKYNMMLKKEEPPQKEEVAEVETEVEEEVPKEEAKVETPKEKKPFLKSFLGRKKDSGVSEQINQSTVNPKDDPPKKEEKEEEITEMTPEVIERLAQKAKEQAEEGEEGKKEEKKSGGFLKSIFGKKEKQEDVKEMPTAKEEIKEVSVNTETYSEPQAIAKQTGPDYGVEIEKIKVMVDTIRESGKVTDESVRGLSESIGEIRSMVFQADAELKEVALKMERTEDEINEIKPQEIQKKFREFNETFEKHQLELEKLNKKAEDSGEKINKVLEMLKSIGGIENLINVNQEVQKKLGDINEAMKYIERIGAKTEKMFIDLNRGLQDLIVIKARQEDFNESLKDIVKNIDTLNIKFEGYITKKDLDSFKEDMMLIKKQLEDIKKVLPVAELKLPENIINLRKEREDIRLFLDSLEEQFSGGKITKEEVENIKDANLKRLEEIRTSLDSEWKKIEKLIKPVEKEEGAEIKMEEEKAEEGKIKEIPTAKEEIKTKKATIKKILKKETLLKREKTKKIIKKKKAVKKPKPPKKIIVSTSKRKEEILNELKGLG